MRLLEVMSLTFHDEHRNHHHGQSDQTLRAFVGDRCVGWIDYSVYQGEPSVQMIEVVDQRRGYGSALIRKLQSMFPDTEIDMGMLTDDGMKLIGGMPHIIVHDPEYKAKRERLDGLLATEREYQRAMDAFDANPSDEARRALPAVNRWNDLNDAIRELEQELHYMKPSKKIFR
jgi:hypothetical protein